MLLGAYILFDQIVLREEGLECRASMTGLIVKR